jgi:hypothetical protein
MDTSNFNDILTEEKVIQEKDNLQIFFESRGYTPEVVERILNAGKELIYKIERGVVITETGSISSEELRSRIYRKFNSEESPFVEAFTSWKLFTDIPDLPISSEEFYPEVLPTPRTRVIVFMPLAFEDCFRVVPAKGKKELALKTNLWAPLEDLDISSTWNNFSSAGVRFPLANLLINLVNTKENSVPVTISNADAANLVRLIFTKEIIKRQETNLKEA